MTDPSIRQTIKTTWHISLIYHPQNESWDLYILTHNILYEENSSSHAEITV